MTTKHAKSLAAAPHFHKVLGASVLEYPLDTDSLGTFSGEVDRKCSSRECARRKCEWGLDLLGVELGLASEGSFGPHPTVPFIPCGHEILYFIDRRRNIHLHVGRLCERTNYRMQAIESYDELLQFAIRAGFPSHGMIVRPTPWQAGQILFKGIDAPDKLESAFHESKRLSESGQVWVETDMRAQFNPTRMAEISVLSRSLAERLAARCPVCHSPGWGLVETENGLKCQSCDQPTELIAQEILGCAVCSHRERTRRRDGVQRASPRYCSRCNP
jgi:hypothetical protein